MRCGSSALRMSAFREMHTTRRIASKEGVDSTRFCGQCRDTANGALGHVAGNWSHAIDILANRHG